MIGKETLEVERKVIAILKVLKDSPEPVGSKRIACQLRDCGIYLSERAIRYHLKHLDRSGFTYLKGRRFGRLLTQNGLNELSYALAGDRLGSAMTNIEKLTYQTSFSPEKRQGEVPINVSLFSSDEFRRALKLMKGVFSSNLCISDLVAVAGEGENLGGVKVPAGKTGFATISNITISSALLKAGILLDFKFAGILQIRDDDFLRFIELIEYTGSTLNPYEVFISSKMTSVGEVSRESNGKILASFCELPALALPRAEEVINVLKTTGIDGVAKLGGVSEPVCQTPVSAGKFGIILTDGLNLVAAAIEAGMEVINHAASGIIDFAKLKSLHYWLKH